MNSLDPRESAHQAFIKARGKSLLRQIWAALHGQSDNLLAFDEVKNKLKVGAPIYRGIKVVPISQIAGSVNRYRDFDRAFLPSQTHTKGRWENIGEARFRDVQLPPVQLYKVGEVYFVMDGNHRVSVARELGQEFIDAEVHECRVRVPVRPGVDRSELERISQKVDFVEYTGIDEIRPDVDIELTMPGGYYRLLEHIETHRYLQGQEWEREFTLEEAVGQWVDQVYLPTMEVIRETNILEEFPNRTEADLYMWLSEHAWYLREQFGEEVSKWDAARSFAEHFSERPLKRLWHFITERILP